MASVNDAENQTLTIFTEAFRLVRAIPLQRHVLIEEILVPAEWAVDLAPRRRNDSAEDSRSRCQISLSDSPTRYRSDMAASVDFTISFDRPDEEGWIIARVLEVPGAMSQGRTREEARENVLDALQTVLTPDEELAGRSPRSDHEHLRFTAAA
jgi:predicted RNase H-like HicB family nuclease